MAFNTLREHRPTRRKLAMTVISSDAENVVAIPEASLSYWGRAQSIASPEDHNQAPGWCFGSHAYPATRPHVHRESGWVYQACLPGECEANNRRWQDDTENDETNSSNKHLVT
jgi:hypothetical protein